MLAATFLGKGTGCGSEPQRNGACVPTDEVWYDGLDQDCHGGSDYDQDHDGYDSFGYGGADCNDIDSTIYPNAVETENGLDDDCDGAVDDELPSSDDDGDGLSENEGDCDDTDSGISPSADDVAYDGIDQDCDGSDLTDVDGDGCTAEEVGGRDCDDRDDEIWPGADEIPYDGIDQDCDGADQVDVDHDGYDGEAVDGEDCDDTDPTINPAAREVCGDSVDQDCSGDPDDGAVDADGDGYVDIECTDGNDCDDANAAVTPDALEACGDSVDQDCSGDPDDGVTDSDSDGHVSDSCSGGDDCDDGDSAVNPDAVEICGNAVDDDCSGTWAGCGIDGTVDLATADARLVGETAGDHAGWSLWSGDPDGDGIGEIMAGAPYEDAGGNSAGAVYVAAGVLSGDTSLADADTKLVGTSTFDHAGNAVWGGDLDGDSVTDVLVGAPYRSDGAVHYVAGPLPGTLDLDRADALIKAVDTNDRAGWSVWGGDLDGDAVGDVLVGAPYADGGVYYGGTAYFLSGVPSGTVDLATSADATLGGEDYGDLAGASLWGGDLDGDGLGDVLVGAYGEDSAGSSAGAVYLLCGPPSGTVSLAAADAKIVGEDSYDLAGWAIWGGDLDGDGWGDLLIGATGEEAGGGNAGAAYFLSGPVTGSVDLSAATAKLVGETSGDYAGSAVWGGDLDADGTGDVLVGAYGEDAGGSSAGAVYFLSGPLTGTTDLSSADGKMVGEAAGDYAGWTVRGEDLDGNGVGDVLVGAYGSDLGGSDAGAIYVVLNEGS